MQGGTGCNFSLVARLPSQPLTQYQGSSTLLSSSPLDFSHLAVWRFSLIRQATHEQRSPLSSVPAPEQMLSRSSCLREFLDVFYVLAKVEAGSWKA